MTAVVQYGIATPSWRQLYLDHRQPRMAPEDDPLGGWHVGCLWTFGHGTFRLMQGDATHTLRAWDQPCPVDWRDAHDVYARMNYTTGEVEWALVRLGRTRIPEVRRAAP